MPNYVAFVRAINVSGRYIRMPVGADHLKEIGYQEVQTFINTVKCLISLRY
jgi:uncharacterized protein (DUF1697 family)